MRLSSWLALRCKEPLFRRFLGVKDEPEAVEKVRAICEVKSRGEIDTNPTAAARFHQFIRRPYSTFCNKEAA